MAAGQETACLDLHAGHSAGHERHVHLVHAVCLVRVPDVHCAGRVSGAAGVALAAVRAVGGLCHAARRVGVAVCQFPVGGLRE